MSISPIGAFRSCSGTIICELFFQSNESKPTGGPETRPVSDPRSCPNCKSAAEMLRREDAGNDIDRSCQRCGHFRHLASAIGPVGRLNAEQQAQLSRWVFHQNSRDSIPRLTREVLERVMTRPFPTISEWSDYLLLEALRGQTILAATFNIKEPRFIATTDSQDANDVVFLFRMLSGRGLMQTTVIGGECKVLPGGYVAVDVRARWPGSSDKGFVASTTPSIEILQTISPFVFNVE